MSFIVYINGNPYKRDKYQEAEDTLREALAYWNNFGDHQPLELKIEKEKDEALQVKVEDGIFTEDKGPGQH